MLRVVVLGEVAVLGEVFVAVVRDEAEQRLLEVGAGDREPVDEARADRRARGVMPSCADDIAPATAQNILPAALDVSPVGDQRVARRAGVEVLVVREDELEDGELAPVHGAELQRFAHELVGVGASHARIDLSQPAAAAANSLEMSVNVPIWTFASTGPTA
jgi:hypothetical protein